MPTIVKYDFTQYRSCYINNNLAVKKLNDDGPRRNF
jgi:hypothetical protein